MKKLKYLIFVLLLFPVSVLAGSKYVYIDDDVSIIKTKYITNSEEGTIAIVGPKRMNYEKVVSLLEYIKENIERQ